MLQVIGTRATLLTAAGLLAVLSIGGLLLTRAGRSDAPAETEAPPGESHVRVRRAFIAIAALTGLAVTVIEFSAVRFMAPWFGQSNYVWANVIGVILLALALGSWIGGRWADAVVGQGVVGERVGGERALYTALSLGAVFVGLVTLFGPTVMEVLVPQDIDGMPIDSMHVLPIAFRGSLVATVLFFGPALLLLGVVPPFLVRMGTAGRHAGRTAGVLFAWTTVGGLLGCFLTSSPWPRHSSRAGSSSPTRSAGNPCACSRVRSRSWSRPTRRFASCGGA